MRTGAQRKGHSLRGHPRPKHKGLRASSPAAVSRRETGTKSCCRHCVSAVPLTSRSGPTSASFPKNFLMPTPRGLTISCFDGWRFRVGDGETGDCDGANSRKRPALRGSLFSLVVNDMWGWTRGRPASAATSAPARSRVVFGCNFTGNSDHRHRTDWKGEDHDQPCQWLLG